MYFIIVRISYNSALKRVNGVILGGHDITGVSWGSFFGKLKKKSNLSEIYILKTYFILVKFSDHKGSLNVQKREKCGFLGGYDVTGGSWDLVLEKGEKVKFC